MKKEEREREGERERESCVCLRCVDVLNHALYCHVLLLLFLFLPPCPSTVGHFITPMHIVSLHKKRRSSFSFSDHPPPISSTHPTLCPSSHPAPPFALALCSRYLRRRLQRCDPQQRYSPLGHWHATSSTLHCGPIYKSSLCSPLQS